jgi:hypothetical protein
MNRYHIWVRSLLRARARDEVMMAFGMFLFACAAGFVTTFVVFGAFLILGIVLAALAITPPHPTVIAPVVIVLQLVVFYWIKPKFPAPITVERVEDTGELIVLKPEIAERPTLFYNQEGGSLRATVLTIALAVAIAINEVIKHLYGAVRMLRADKVALGRIAEHVASRGMKVTYDELQQQFPDIDVGKLLPQMDRLSEFNLLMSHPQGVALTDGAYE